MPWKKPFSDQSSRCSWKSLALPKRKLHTAVSIRPKAMNLRASLRSDMAPIRNLPSP